MAVSLTTSLSRRTLRLPLNPHIVRSRTFASSSRCMINPLLNLAHFSASKEAQFLSKERKIPRTEFSPYLELIRSSEVDPFAPAPGASPSAVAALKRAQSGQSDMQTAYALAIKNLIQQLQTSRNEVIQTRNTLFVMREKYKRDERNTFIVMLTTVALLALILVKTDALEDIKDYARHTTSHWKGFDWEWLGHPPSHKNSYRQSAHAISTSESPPVVLSAPIITPLAPIEAQSDRQMIKGKVLASAPELVQQPTRWSLSRLFWANPAKADP